ENGRKLMEPEFIIDEEPLMQVPALLEAAVAAGRREHELRQALSEKKLTYEKELLNEASVMKTLIGAVEERCDQLVRTEKQRLGKTDGDAQPIEDETRKWIGRLESIYKAFDNVLTRHGITRYVPSGAAIPGRDQIQDTLVGTGLAAGTIVEVSRPGYV